MPVRTYLAAVWALYLGGEDRALSIFAAIWKMFRGTRSTPIIDSEARLIANLKQIARESSGTVAVLVPSGRKTVPDELMFGESTAWVDSQVGETFISCPVRIDEIDYVFGAEIHPTSNVHSIDWLYYWVEGPCRENGHRGRFQITDEFRWTGERPWNPLLVKYSLRQWVARPEVKAAIKAAEKHLRRADQRRR